MITTSIKRLTSDECATVEANLGLIGWMVARMGIPARNREDAYQDGVFGLSRAAQRFEPERGVTFSTFAAFWIRKSILEGRDTLAGVNWRRSVRTRVEFVDETRLGGFTAQMQDIILGAALEEPSPFEPDLVAAFRQTVAELPGNVQSLLTLSLSEYAALAGVSHQAISKRRQRLMADLRERLQHLYEVAA